MFKVRSLVHLAWNLQLSVSHWWWQVWCALVYGACYCDLLLSQQLLPVMCRVCCEFIYYPSWCIQAHYFSSHHSVPMQIRCGGIFIITSVQIYWEVSQWNKYEIFSKDVDMSIASQSLSSTLSSIMILLLW